MTDPDFTAPAARVAVVKRWFDAWNDGDLEGLLACMDRRVEFHPVIPRGTAIEGHADFSAWHRERTAGSADLHMAVGEAQPLDGDRVLVSGEVLASRDDRSGIPFTAIYTVRDGLVVVAEQYLSDPQLMKRIGLLSAVMTPAGETIRCAHCGVAIEAQRPLVMVRRESDAGFWHQHCFIAAYGESAGDAGSAEGT